MAYTLSNLIRDAITQKGRSAWRMISATGGSTTTVVDTKLGSDFTDEDPSLLRGTALVVYDAGGAGAAPEGEFQRISNYTESNQTVTVDTAFTVAPAAGDKVMLITSQFPIDEMIRLANDTLQQFGTIPLTDTSLVTADNQTEYTLPVALKFKKPTRVQMQTLVGDADDNRYEDVNNWYIAPALPGSTGLLVLPPNLVSGRTLKVWYEGIHPVLTTYSSPVNETLHRSYVSWALTAAIWDWTEPDNPLDLRHLDAASANRDKLRGEFGMWHPEEERPIIRFTEQRRRR